MKAFLYSLILFLCTNGTILTAAEKTDLMPILFQENWK